MAMYAPSLACGYKDQATGECIPGIPDPGWPTDVPYPGLPYDGDFPQGDGTQEANMTYDPGWTGPYPEVPCGGTHEQGSDTCVTP